MWGCDCCVFRLKELEVFPSSNYAYAQMVRVSKFIQSDFVCVCVCVRWFPRPLTYSLNCIIHIPPPSGNQSAHARIDIYQLWRLKYSFIRIWFHHKLIFKKKIFNYGCPRIYRSITSHIFTVNNIDDFSLR
jgi:hypothetical protein